MTATVATDGQRAWSDALKLCDEAAQPQDTREAQHRRNGQVRHAALNS